MKLQYKLEQYEQDVQLISPKKINRYENANIEYIGLNGNRP